ncbi:MAG: putative zinc-binding protein [Chloroflexi bacterium]|nr:putative zinc-binding protein [Chloroflexota bacterium]
MPDLPGRKVGIVACSGEELAEGTVTRLAALKVLEETRPGQTVTICLPLFLAGGEGDRAFARFYPTIAVDGCEERCAARATELHSGKPAASVVVSDIVRELGLPRLVGARRLDDGGRQAVEATADRLAGLVDELLGGEWDRRRGAVPAAAPSAATDTVPLAGCACASAIPVQVVDVAGREVPVAALPLIFEQFRDAGKAPGVEVTRELLATVKIYNDLPAGIDEELAAALGRDYATFCAPREVAS